MNATDQIRAAIPHYIQQIILDLLPDGQPTKCGREWNCLNPLRADTTLGSFGINISGDEKSGLFYDFASGHSGDLFDLVMAVTNCDFTTAKDYLARACGIAASGPSLHIPRISPDLALKWKQRSTSPEALGRGCTVAQLAEAKMLPVEFLRELGLVDWSASADFPASVAIPYAHGLRIRCDISAKLGSRWKRGSVPGLYGIDRLPKDVKGVLLVEGESDCWVCWHAGINAVGIPGASMWRDEWAALLPSVPIYIVQEPDAAGAGLVERLKKSPLAVRLRPIHLLAKDPAEAWVNHPSLDAFRATMASAMNAANAPTATIKTFAETPSLPLEWVWKDYIPRGMVSVISGAGGLGKSYMFCDIAARLSTGTALPGEDARPPMRTLLLIREDDPSRVLRGRLLAAGGDLSLISWSEFAWEGGTQSGECIELGSKAGRDELIKLIEGHHIDLVVIDTFAAFASEGTDANSGGDVRTFLNAMQRVAERTYCGLCVIGHTNKRIDPDAPLMNAIAGSGQMTAGVRAAAILQDGRESGTRWLRPAKTNLGPIGTGLTWRLQAIPGQDFPVVAWASPSQETVREAVSGATTVRPAEAAAELVKILDAQGGLLSKSGAITSLQAALTGRKGLRTKDCSLAVESLLSNEVALADSGLVVRRTGNSVQVGLAGRLPETPEDRARRLAVPGMSYRDLQALAGCSNTVAREALRTAPESP